MFKRFSQFSIVATIPPIVGLFVFPIYSNYIPIEDYGIRAIVLLAIIIFRVFSDFGTNWVIRKKYFEFNNENEKNSYITTLLLFSFFLKLFIGTIAFLLKDITMPIIFNVWGKTYTELFSIQIFIFLLSFPNNIITPLLIFSKDLKQFSFYRLGNYFIFTSLSLLFMIRYNAGIKAIFYGELIAAFIILIYSLRYLSKYFTLSLTKSIFNDILNIGLPAFPKNILSQLQLNINKYLLSIYMGPAEVGILHKSEFMYKGLLGFQKSFWNTISPDNMKKITEMKEDKKSGNSVIAFTYLISLMIIISSLFLEKIFIIINVHPSYMICAQYAPIYAYYVLIAQFAILFFNNILASGKTYLFAIRSIIGGIINIIANIYLIQLYGIIGAIIAVLISIFIGVILQIFFTKFILRSQVNINIIVWLLQLLIVAIFLYYIYNIPEIDLMTSLFIIILASIWIYLIDRYYAKALKWTRPYPTISSE